VSRLRFIPEPVSAWYTRRLTRRARRAVALALAGVLAGILFASYAAVKHYWFPGTNPCLVRGATVVLHEGDAGACVGLSDGSFDFDPSLAAVDREIRQENQRVTAAHPTAYVSVVLLLPISSGSGSLLSMANALEQVRGAYVAQYRANRGSVEGITPYIQLLIASNGYQANQWSQTDRIIEDAADREHIAAVTGLGLSLDTTESAAKQLTAAGMPVIGATITSDHFDNIRNLIRVAPSNRDAISVAVAYARLGFARGLLIEDENAGDTYDATVVAGFEKFTDTTHQIIGREPYDTTTRDNATSPEVQRLADEQIRNRLSQMAPDICLAQPAVVLFAGRGRDLAYLLDALSNRVCQDKQITIVTGDDVTNIQYSAAVRQSLASNVTVDYSGVANPDEWKGASERAQRKGLQGFDVFNGLFQKLFPDAALSDGNTMMAYDAVLAGVSAIRLTSLPQPPRYAVAGEFSALQGEHIVLGASGPLLFVPDYNHSANGSDPVRKPVPILRLLPGGGSEFVALKWPGGEPQIP
jgi:ABC-type branched-subunit amino acid transport system substrate-binding protein